MKVQDASKIKGLETRIAKLTSEAEYHQGAANEHAAQESARRKTIKKLENEIQSIKDANKGLTVTEHAMLRFLERKMDVSPQNIIEAILTDQLKATYAALGDGTHPTGTGIRAVIKNGTVVTMK